MDRIALAAARELAHLGVTCNAVNPGPTDTGWMTEEQKADVIRCTPLGRLGARERLTGRERGPELEHELESSARKARILDEQTPLDTVRVATDGRSVVDIAREVVGATGWLPTTSA